MPVLVVELGKVVDIEPDERDMVIRLLHVAVNPGGGLDDVGEIVVLVLEKVRLLIDIHLILKVCDLVDEGEIIDLLLIDEISHLIGHGLVLKKVSEKADIPELEVVKFPAFFHAPHPDKPS
jgi:hypothetical protein